MPKMKKLQVDVSYKEDLDDEFPMTFCKMDFKHSGEKSAFTQVKSKNVNDAILEDYQQKDAKRITETMNQRKDAFRSIKGLFRSGIKQVCPCIKEKESKDVAR
jgi:hypothetical protein